VKNIRAKFVRHLQTVFVYTVTDMELSATGFNAEKRFAGVFEVSVSLQLQQFVEICSRCNFFVCN